MKPLCSVIPVIALAISSSLEAATFLANGTIEDPLGTPVGTWAYTTTGTAGFGSPGQVVGASGIQINYPGAGGNNPDVLALNITISPLAGYSLDELIISQSAYENSAGNNGGGAADPGPVYSIAGYTGSFTANTGTGPQIIAPAVTGGNLDWQQAGGQVFNNVDDWQVVLTDPSIAGGYTANITSTLNANMFQDWITVDAVFSIPEPSRALLVVVGGLALGIRRRR